MRFNYRPGGACRRLWLCWLIFLTVGPGLLLAAEVDAVEKGPGKPGLSLAFFIPGSEPFWDANVRYAQAAARDLGVGFKLVIFHDDPAVLLDGVERECRAGVGGLIFPAFAAAGEAALKIAEKYHTPAFIINTGIKDADFLPRTKYRYWVGRMTPDDVGVGARLIQQLLGLARAAGASRFHILALEGRPDQEASISRRRGLENHLKYAEGVASLVAAEGDRDPEKVAALVKQQYADNPALNVVWCANDNMALAAADAVRELNVTTPVFLGGVDWDPRALKAIEDGRMHADVGGHFFEGAWAVLLMHDYLQGRDFATEGLEFTTSMPAVTRDNLSSITNFLSLDPAGIDFRRYSKVYNPTRLEYKLDLADVAEDARAAPEQSRDSLVLTSDEKAWLQARPRIAVAVMDAWPPFNMADAQGKAEGIGVDYLELLGERLGVAFNIVPGPFADNLEAVRQKRIDALMDVTPKPEREEYLNFTKPYLDIPHVIVGRSDGPYHENELSLSGKTLALEKGFGNVKYFREQYPKVKVVELPDTEACLLAVSRGAADAYAGNRAAATYIIAQKIFTNLKVQGVLRKPGSILAIGVRKDQPLLAVLLDKALATVTSAERQAILRRWTGGEGLDGRVDLTPEEEAWVKTHPTVTVAALTDFPPLHYVDDSGAYTGVAVEMLKIAARRLGIALQPEFGTWSEGLAAVRDKRLDLLPEVVDTPERREYLAFTKPFLLVPHVLAIRHDSPVRSAQDLSGKRLALEKGYYSNDLIRKQIPGAHIVEAATTLDALNAVAEGRAEAYVGNKALIDYLLAKNNLASLATAPFPELEPLRLSLGARRDWAPIIPLLEKGLDSLTPAEKREISRRFIFLPETAANKPVLTAEEKNWLKSHPELIVGALPDRPPFEFTDEEGRYAGLVSEYLTRLEEILSVKLTPRLGLDRPGALAAIKNKEIDVIPTMAGTGGPDKFLRLTRPYIRVPLVVVTRGDAAYLDNLDRLAGLETALARSDGAPDLIERDHPGLKLVVVDAPEEALRATSAGRTAAAVVNLASFTYLTTKLDLHNLKVAAPTPYTLDLSFAVREDLPELAVILDKALASIPEKDKAVFQEHWVNIRVERRIDWAVALPLASAATLAVCLILAVIIRANRKLAREFRERARAEQKMQAMSSAIHDALIMIDAQARVMYWNHAAETLFGITARDAMGRDMHGLFAPPEFQEQARAGLRTFAKTGQGPVLGKLLELTARRADGVLIPVEVGVSAFQVEEEWFAVGIVRDITERKKTEEQIRTAREELLLIFDNSQVGIVFMLGDCRLARLNRRLAEILGYDSPREMIDFDMGRLHPDEESYLSFKQSTYAVLIQGRQAKFECQLQGKDGAAVWCSMSGKAVDPAVPPDLGKGVIWVIDDITKRRQAEELLRESQSRLDLALSASNTGLWDWSPLENKDYHNDQWYRQLGYTREELADKKDQLLELMHPEDAAVFTSAMDEYIVGRTDDYFQEFRMKAKDGSWKWILSVGKVAERDETGRTKRIIGVHLDMTERKKAEQELQRNLDELERFSRLVVGRELKMIELKTEVNSLLEHSGQEKKYKIVE
ncbi:MAG: transporter substrate-binding domain-containing protein [Pseudomonadota bacterium]